MVIVSLPIFDGMTDAEAREAILAYVEARWQALDQEVDARIAAAVAPLQDAIASLTAAAVQYGHHVALKADAGQFLSAELGGPTEEKQPFDLQSRATAGAWESWAITKGSQ